MALILHVRWYTVDKAAGGEVVSGFGAALVVLGVLVASRPYIRTGFAGLVEAGLPLRPVIVPIGGVSIPRLTMAELRRERPRVVLDVVAERVVAITVVILGTLLNGYGAFVARLLHLRGS